jgi:CP family cyanate transporter-like MFS transporter
LRRAPVGVLAGLFLASLALRAQIIAVGPLLPSIQASLGLSHAVAGLLTTIPVLCMGLFAPATALLSSRYGSRAVIAASLALIAAAGLLRVSVDDAAVLLVFTIPVGIGIAFAGTLMPTAVKERFAARPNSATGIYASGIQLGAGAAAALAIPLADRLGGWRWSLAAFSVATALLAGVWLVASRDWPTHLRSRVRPRMPVRSALAWRLVASFALIGLLYYGLTAWLADAYVEHGWSESKAGWLFAVFQIATVPAGFVIGFAADRRGSRRSYLVGFAALYAAGLLGVVLLPGAGFVWAVLLGTANGACFPMVMMLPLDVAHEPAEAGAVAGMMLGVGYTIVSLSPFVLGAIRDATGSFSAALWVLVAIAALMVTVSSTLTPERLQHGIKVHTRLP